MAGRHFLQVPGPSNTPDRILRAMDNAVMDHRGPAFADVCVKALEGMKSIFKTTNPIVIFPATGTGDWEAALVNTFSSGDRVLMYETGHFATLWKKLAERLGVTPEFIAGDWRSGADQDRIETRLRKDAAHEIRAVCVVHNETSIGSVSPIESVRRAIDNANHPALLMVDTISGLASTPFEHDAWGVDVAVAGSQKGLMLPPGLSFNALSPKAIESSKSAGLPKSYWAWDEMLTMTEKGYLPYTPATNMLYGLHEAINILHEEGLENVFARHARHAAATCAAVRAWRLEVLGKKQGQENGVLTAVMMPEHHSADVFRQTPLARYD